MNGTLSKDLPNFAFHDQEYDLRMTGNPPPVGVLDGAVGYQEWQILRPAIVSIELRHIYPQHGQFADWELGTKAFPSYINPPEGGSGG